VGITRFGIYIARLIYLKTVALRLSKKALKRRSIKNCVVLTPFAKDYRKVKMTSPKKKIITAIAWGLAFESVAEMALAAAYGSWGGCSFGSSHNSNEVIAAGQKLGLHWRK
jgi:hypothetical protein